MALGLCLALPAAALSAEAQTERNRPGRAPSDSDPESDLILGGPGNDEIRGGRGDDILRGGPGDDVIRGGPGRDVIEGGTGNDLLEGDGDEVLREYKRGP